MQGIKTPSASRQVTEVTRNSVPKQSGQVRDYFDQRARRWSTFYGDNGTMTGRVYRFLEALQSHAEPPARVLDYGCGTGQIAIGLADAGYKVEATDISRSMIEEAWRSCGDKVRVHHIVPVESRPLPFDDASFDAVVSSSVLEYIPRPESVFAEFSRILKPGGTAFVTVPNIRTMRRRIEGAARPGLVLCSMLPGVRRTRLGIFGRYLKLSINRYALEGWSEVAREGAMEIVKADGTDDLTMLVLRQINPS